MAAATENELALLHQAVARYLTVKIGSDECTASDVSNAIKMLKDNNITCAPAEASELDELGKALEKRGQRPAPVDRADLEGALDHLDFQGSVN